MMDVDRYWVDGDRYVYKIDRDRYWMNGVRYTTDGDRDRKDSYRGAS
jgi:hypothetical protein